MGFLVDETHLKRKLIFWRMSQKKTIKNESQEALDVIQW
jgi:hypothetical protein